MQGPAVPYGRGRPLPPPQPRARASSSGLEGRRFAYAGGLAGRVLEVRNGRALIQPDPVRTRTRQTIGSGRQRREVIAGELLEWGADFWVELRRLSPA